MMWNKLNFSMLDFERLVEKAPATAAVIIIGLFALADFFMAVEELVR